MGVALHVLLVPRRRSVHGTSGLQGRDPVRDRPEQDEEPGPRIPMGLEVVGWDHPKQHAAHGGLDLTPNRHGEVVCCLRWRKHC